MLNTEFIINIFTITHIYRDTYVKTHLKIERNFIFFASAFIKGEGRIVRAQGIGFHVIFPHGIFVLFPTQEGDLPVKIWTN